MPAASFFTYSHLLEPPMRPFLPIAITALALAACGKDREADSGGNAGAGLTADTIVANDVTAIDAVTADAANMAADIDYADALAELSNNGGESNVSRANRSGGTARPNPGRAPAPATESPRETPAETATNSE